MEKTVTEMVKDFLWMIKMSIFVWKYETLSIYKSLSLSLSLSHTHTHTHLLTLYFGQLIRAGKVVFFCFVYSKDDIYIDTMIFWIESRLHKAN